jgi:hypothetical protein
MADADGCVPARSAQRFQQVERRLPALPLLSEGQRVRARLHLPVRALIDGSVAPASASTGLACRSGPYSSTATWEPLGWWIVKAPISTKSHPIYLNFVSQTSPLREARSRC